MTTRPTARLFTGPGPAAYTLPSTIGYEKHNNRKTRQPQFTIGKRLKPLNSATGPGPCPYEEKTYKKLVYRKRVAKKTQSTKKALIAVKNPRWMI